MSFPNYYSGLAPFRKLFAAGHPVLTYHHVGPRQPGVRIKGLYVSARLFQRHMAELSAAGFVAQPMDSRTSGAPRGRRITLTFDDGFRDVLDNALPVLQQHGFHAMLFLVADLLGKTNVWQQSAGDAVEPLMDQTQVREWLAAGHEIGSHTLSHPHLTRIPLAEAREEIVACKRKLEDLFGSKIEHFCYPYGDWNDAVRDLVGEAGYVTACTTEFGVNTASTPPLALRRITARYPSRNLKAIWSRLRARLPWG